MMRQPTVAMPPMYFLPGTHWGVYWCKLGEVLSIAHELSDAAGTNLRWTPEEFVRAFAEFILPNEPPRGETVGVKIFRFSLDGTGFSGTKIPKSKVTAHEDFRLNVDGEYPSGMFVPASWVSTTLLTIMSGAKDAHQMDQHCFGLPKDGGTLIHPVLVIHNTAIDISGVSQSGHL